MFESASKEPLSFFAGLRQLLLQDAVVPGIKPSVILNTPDAELEKAVGERYIAQRAEKGKAVPEEPPSVFRSYGDCCEVLEGAAFIEGKSAEGFCTWLHHHAETIWPKKQSV
jgi:hypothetical protein